MNHLQPLILDLSETTCPSHDTLGQRASFGITTKGTPDDCDAGGTD